MKEIALCGAVLMLTVQATEAVALWFLNNFRLAVGSAAGAWELRNVHKITSASCSLSLWERAGVREYKWSSYFMRVPKRIMGGIFCVFLINHLRISWCNSISLLPGIIIPL